MAELTYRHELKFLCTERELTTIENRIRHICRPDPHAGAGGIYSIKSLYFDTYDDKCCYENQMGVDNRKKYRVRIYNGNASHIKLECKHTCRGMKAKETCQITREQCECLMKGKPIMAVGEDQQLLSRFLIEQKLELLRPKVIVEYQRTPYVYVAGNVRVTVDRNIRSASNVATFLEGNSPFRSIMSQNMHVLEVKYDEFIPAAIMECVANNRLMRTSFSKYYLCRKYSIL